MNIKVKLAMQLLAVLYLLISVLLSELNLINSDDFITLPTVIWTIIWVTIILNGKKLSGITDELVISTLSKVNKIGVNFLVSSIGLFSILLISPFNKDVVISKVEIGICLMLILFIFTVIRLLFFIYFDRKGICK